MPADPEKVALAQQNQQLQEQLQVWKHTEAVRQAVADPYKKS